MVFFCFALVFLCSIKNIYVSNVFYFIILLKDAIKEQQISLKKSKIVRLLYLLFMIWVTTTTFFYAIETRCLDSRAIIQYLFTAQYFILIINIKAEDNKLEFWIHRFTVLYSVYIIGVFILSCYNSIWNIKYNLWGIGYIPGWPNSPSMSLLIGLWLSFKNSKCLMNKLLFCSAILLTQSRGGILGMVIIIFYYLIKKGQYKKKYLIIMCILLITSLGCINIFKDSDSFIVNKMKVTGDRTEILHVTMKYVKSRPILGYGGNTIDQIYKSGIYDGGDKNWQHTHNWVLEILLRYGVIGLGLFSLYILAIFINIKNKDKRFMFFVFLCLALFQTFIRDFVFLFYLAYLSKDNYRK